jgi:putative alpha-1,2-mannosidase
MKSGTGYFSRYFDHDDKIYAPRPRQMDLSAPLSTPLIPSMNGATTPKATPGNIPGSYLRMSSPSSGSKAVTKLLSQNWIVSSSSPATSAAKLHPDISGLVGMYAMGNEPNHHIPYLYAFAGYPWKTAEKISRITREFYTAKNDGLCGNDDAGQMSAWYVMSALGFYPVNPANGIFVFGTPLVRKAILQVGEGRRFTMEPSTSAKNTFISNARHSMAFPTGNLISTIGK